MSEALSSISTWRKICLAEPISPCSSRAVPFCSIASIASRSVRLTVAGVVVDGATVTVDLFGSSTSVSTAVRLATVRAWATVRAASVGYAGTQSEGRVSKATGCD